MESGGANPVVTGRKGGIRASGGSGGQRFEKIKADDGVAKRRYDASHHPVALWRRGREQARRDGVTDIEVTTQCLAADAAAQAVAASQGTACHIPGSARMGAMPPRPGDCRGSAESIALPESLSGVWREPRSRREASRGRGVIPVVAAERAQRAESRVPRRLAVPMSRDTPRLPQETAREDASTDSSALRCGVCMPGGQRVPRR